jgi:tetratricopeptide (TPR) repeat protein
VAYRGRGWAYYNLGNSDRAISDYNKAIKLDSEDAVVYYNRGLAYADLGDYDPAIADYSEAIELGHDPLSWPYYSRAVAYYNQGNYERAVANYKRVIELDPDHALTHNNLAWTLAYDLDTNYQEALTYARRSVELNPQAYNHDTLALVYYKLEQYEKALEHYNMALSLDTEHTSSYKGRGDVYLALDNIEATLSDYETYLSLAPPGPERAEIEGKIKSLQ